MNVVSITELNAGADLNAFTHRVEDNENRSFFIKLRKGNADNFGTEFLSFLKSKGIQNIISPIDTILCQHDQNDFNMVIYPYIQGKNGFEIPLLKEQWIALGKTLKQIHSIDVSPEIITKIKHEDFSSKWRKLVLSQLKQLDAIPRDNAITKKMLDFIKDNLETILHLVNRSERLCQIAEKENHAYVLCHSDIHGGNVLIDNSEKSISSIGMTL